MSAQPPGAPLGSPLSADEQAAIAARRRRGRNWALLAVLIGLSVLFYAMTLVKLGHQG